ncbi:uncharacterized protein UBRO_08127 [Ustilago bromivora]|uniref:Effector family protein Eff1 n=1 Tax=Ustilago bromivora TaxID=307758 RepID=A0A1K0HKC4_9BASI|nr:uncharacterized protein UBRO_08127 [Ustilago bromivora]
MVMQPLNVWPAWLISFLLLLPFAAATSFSTPNIASAEDLPTHISSTSSDIAWRRALATADDATSHINSFRPYPGTSVPDTVMRYLVHERHGIDHHLPMSIIPEHRMTLESKVDELLYDPRRRTPVSHLKYEGQTYFLFPAWDFHDLKYPRWSWLWKEPEGIRSIHMQPFFLAKVNLWDPERKYELMAVRTTATAEDKQYFADSLKLVRRKLMTFPELLYLAARGH